MVRKKQIERKGHIVKSPAKNHGSTRLLIARARKQPDHGEGIFISLYVDAIRAIVPAIDADLLKFFLIATAYSDQQGTLFPGVREMARRGYHPEETTAYFRQCVAVGLLRVIQQGGWDKASRSWRASVYQISPALIRIHPSIMDMAMKQASQPFESLPVFDDSLIGDSPSTSDHKQIKKQIKDQADSNQVEPNKQITRGARHQNGEFQQRLSEQNAQTPNALIGEQGKNSDQGRKANRQTARSARSAQANTEGNPTTPPLPPASPQREKVDLAPFAAPLKDDIQERAAELFVATAGNTTPAWGRYLVHKFGPGAVMTVVKLYQRARETGGIANPAGWMRRQLDMGAGNKPIPAQQVRNYDMSKLDDCMAAINDATLSEEVREVYRVALHSFKSDDSQGWYLPR